MAIANKIKLSDGTVIDLASGGLVLGETSGTAYEGSKGKKNADDIITLQDDVANLTTGKQDKLISGTNIKTLNGQSILGSGNLEIQGGGTSIPTIKILTSQATSQNPITIQLTNEQYNTFSSSKSVIVDTSDFASIGGAEYNYIYIWNRSYETASTFSFMRIQSVDITTYATLLIDINKNTKIGILGGGQLQSKLIGQEGITIADTNLISLERATTSSLGGVKVGNGLKIDTQGTLSVDVATNTEIDALFN